MNWFLEGIVQATLIGKMTTGFNAPAAKVLVLSESSEADAPSQIRAIYEEIRELCGAPMVALIFRHLAAHPSV